MNPVYVKLFKKQNKLLLSKCILIHLAGVIWIFNKVLKRVVKQCAVCDRTAGDAAAAVVEVL